MAIVVEEEQRSRQGLGGLIAALVIFVVLGVGVYYVFFKKPELVEVVGTRNNQQIPRITLQPDEVLNSPGFQALRSYAEPVNPATGPGVANPFLGNF